jgi:hypothetical protein
MGGWGESGKDRAQVEYMATKTNATPLELELSTAMGFDRPPLLFDKGSGEVDTLRCSNIDEWMGTGLSVSFLKTTLANVAKMLSGLKGTLRHQKGDTRLAGYLLDGVDRQFTRLVAFINVFHQELTTVANFPDKSAWKLIGRCLGGFFQTMVPVRSEVALFGEYQSIDRKAHVIWVVLQCHAVIDQFVALDFKGHTSMVQQMTLYMMTERVDPTQVAHLKSLVVDSNKASIDAVKQLKAVVDSLEKLKTENINNKRTMGDLKREIDQLKAKKQKV